MEISKTALVMGAIIIIALFFLVAASGDSSTTGQAVSSAGQFVGGGCGR